MQTRSGFRSGRACGARVDPEVVALSANWEDMFFCKPECCYRPGALRPLNGVMPALRTTHSAVRPKPQEGRGVIEERVSCGLPRHLLDHSPGAVPAVPLQDKPPRVRSVSMP